MRIERIMFSGFGGQGIMLIGELVSHAAMIEGKEVSWLPSYGPEMRGGTANCSVTISDALITSPIVSEPSILVAMNGPSLDKFEQSVIPGGYIFLNASAIDRKPVRSDIAAICVESVRIAEAIGNGKMANMVMLGALVKTTGIVSMASLESAMAQKFTGVKERFIPFNKQALNAWHE